MAQLPIMNQIKYLDRAIEILTNSVIDTTAWVHSNEYILTRILVSQFI